MARIFKQITMTLRLPPDLSDWLTAYAKATERNKSQVIRYALQCLKQRS